MPYREFTDPDGAEWRAWETRPAAGANVRNALAGGWLSFQSGRQRRRLAPVPEGWGEQSDEQLRAWLDAAEPQAEAEIEDLPDAESEPGRTPVYSRTRRVLDRAQEVLRSVEDTLKRTGH
jgi:hypothetical protein